MRKNLILCAVTGISLLSSCSVNISNINNDNTLDLIKKKNETQEIDINGISKIDLDIDVGDCSVIFDSESKSMINVDYEFKSTSNKRAEKAMENTELHCDKKGDTLYISFINSETGKKIENTNLLNIITVVKLSLPENNMSFDISSDVGSIDIDGFSGSFDISSDVGELNAKDLIITGESSFSADVGDVSLSLSKVEKSEIDISADVGDITLDTQGQDYKEVSSKKDTVEQEKKIVVDGKCNIEMEADVGNITINK